MSPENRKPIHLNDKPKGFMDFPDQATKKNYEEFDMPQFYNDAIRHVLGEIGPLPKREKKIEKPLLKKKIEEPETADIPQFYKDVIGHVLDEIGPLPPREKKTEEPSPEEKTEEPAPAELAVEPETKINPEFLPDPEESEAIDILVAGMEKFGTKGERLAENDIDLVITAKNASMSLTEAAKKFLKYVNRLKGQVESMARVQASKQAQIDKDSRYFKPGEWQKYANRLVLEAVRDSISIVNETLATLPPADKLAKKIHELGESKITRQMMELGFIKGGPPRRKGTSDTKRAESEFRDQAVG